MNNDQKHPRKIDYVEYKTSGFNEFSNSKIKRRAGKASGKYPNWFNIRNLNDNTFLKRKTFVKFP